MCGKKKMCGTHSELRVSCPQQGQLRLLIQGQFSRLSLANHLHILSWCGHASLSQDGLQLASSPSFCPSPSLRASSAHVLGWEIHKNAPNQGPMLLLVSHLKASSGDQLQLLSLGPVSPTSPSCTTYLPLVIPIRIIKLILCDHLSPLPDSKFPERRKHSFLFNFSLNPQHLGSILAHSKSLILT